jgi:1-deoxy-D-xylulose-5-phosphate reductoisomerase
MALDEGGNKPCILNAANETAVRAFLSGEIGFLQIPETVEYALENNSYLAAPDLVALEASDKQARDSARKYINKLKKRK